MLDSQKIREIDVWTPVLEENESSFDNHAKLAVLKALRFFQDLEEAGGMKRFTEMLEQFGAGNAGTGRTAMIQQASREHSENESDFLKAVSETDAETAWEIMDELMDSLRVVNAKVYGSVMRKLQKR